MYSSTAADSVQRWELQPERSWDQIQEQAGELIVMETPEEKLRQRRFVFLKHNISPLSSIFCQQLQIIENNRVKEQQHLEFYLKDSSFLYLQLKILIF